MVKVMKLFGFYSLIISGIPIILIAFLFIFQNNAVAYDWILLFFIFGFLIPIFPLLALIFAIVGLVKDKAKILARVGLTLSILVIILFFIVVFFFRQVRTI